MWGCLSPLTGDVAHSWPRHVSWVGINQQPFGLQVWAQSTELHQPGYIFKLYFLGYAIGVVLFFSPLPPPSPLPSTPYSLRQSPNHCSCPWIMHVSSSAAPFPILYFTSPWLFCNCVLVLLHPIPHTPAHLAAIKTLFVFLILSLFLFA